MNHAMQWVAPISLVKRICIIVGISVPLWLFFVDLLLSEVFHSYFLGRKNIGYSIFVIGFLLALYGIWFSPVGIIRKLLFTLFAVFAGMLFYIAGAIFFLLMLGPINPG